VKIDFKKKMKDEVIGAVRIDIPSIIRSEGKEIKLKLKNADPKAYIIVCYIEDESSFNIDKRFELA
jgi:hypothetical protein